MDPINQPRLKEKSMLKEILLNIFNNSPFRVVNLLYIAKFIAIFMINGIIKMRKKVLNVYYVKQTRMPTFIKMGTFFY